MYGGVRRADTPGRQPRFVSGAPQPAHTRIDDLGIARAALAGGLYGGIIDRSHGPQEHHPSSTVGTMIVEAMAVKLGASGFIRCIGKCSCGTRPLSKKQSEPASRIAFTTVGAVLPRTRLSRSRCAAPLFNETVFFNLIFTRYE
ncbi:hypothetical protein C8R45DRAFT_1077376 [Mycena sanguinolenta]|nr:hypothetical protein C8R45DRAFT_1077376 [Mycena sanguinolenta]